MSGTEETVMAAVSAPQEHHGVRDVKSGARTVELLELLASRQNRPTTIRELSAAMDIPRSSLYALLRTLVGHGWVRSDPTGSVYMIGIRALLAGTSYLDTDAYLRVVQPYLDDLHARFDETFHFGRLDGFDIVYLATRESSQYRRSFSRVGRRMPAYSTALGKSLLADRTGAERAAHLPAQLEPLTPTTLTERSALEADLERTRERGYAIDVEENTVGLTCFAVALAYSEPASDALSVSIPMSRLTSERQWEILSELRAAGQRICDIVVPISAAGWF